MDDIYYSGETRKYTHRWYTYTILLYIIRHSLRPTEVIEQARPIVHIELPTPSQQSSELRPQSRIPCESRQSKRFHSARAVLPSEIIICQGLHSCACRVLRRVQTQCSPASLMCMPEIQKGTSSLALCTQSRFDALSATLLLTAAITQGQSAIIICLLGLPDVSWEILFRMRQIACSRSLMGQPYDISSPTSVASIQICTSPAIHVSPSRLSCCSILLSIDRLME
jgi:hypothetical protein